MPHISHNVTISEHRASYYKTLPVYNNNPPPQDENLQPSPKKTKNKPVL